MEPITNREFLENTDRLIAENEANIRQARNMIEVAARMLPMLQADRERVAKLPPDSTDR